MKTFYEIMDLDTANVVGFYGTREEALAVVRTTYDQHGPDGIRGLALSFQDPRGTLHLVAEGLELGEIARSQALKQPA